MVELNLPLPSPHRPGGWADLTWLRALSLNHVVYLSSMWATPIERLSRTHQELPH